MTGDHIIPAGASETPAAAAFYDRERIKLRRIGEIPPAAPNQFIAAPLALDNMIYLVVGAPQTCKSLFLQEFCLGIATGTPVCGSFAVSKPGPVIYVPGEVAPEFVRLRADGIGLVRGIDVTTADFFICDAPIIDLANVYDQQRIEAYIEEKKPVAVMFDPLRRLFGGDENSSAALSPVLSWMRAVQRRYQVTVFVAHHTGRNTTEARGATARGSSDLWAWADGAIASTAQNESVFKITMEHKHSGHVEPIYLERREVPALHLAVVSPPVVTPPPAANGVESSVLAAFSETNEPLSVKEIAARAGRRHEVVGQTLHALAASNKVMRLGRGRWAKLVPVPGLDDCGSGNGPTTSDSDFIDLDLGSDDDA